MAIQISTFKIWNWKHSRNAISSFDKITLSNIERSFHLSKIYHNQYYFNPLAAWIHEFKPGSSFKFGSKIFGYHFFDIKQCISYTLIMVFFYQILSESD